MNIITLIPARGGSKGIPKKNIKLLGDKPLIVWTIDCAFRAGLERVIVNTDSQEIADIAKQNLAEVMIRPKHLAEDKTSMYEMLKEEVRNITPTPDAILLLQPTVPFRQKKHIELAIEYLKENWDEFDSVITVSKIPQKYHPADTIISNGQDKRMIFSKLKTFKEKLKAFFTGIEYKKPLLSGYPISDRLTRRQQYPDAWIPTGSIYLFKVSNLSRGSIYGDNIMLMETEEEININTSDDFREAELKIVV